MESSGIRIVLVAGAAAVVASWVFDTLGTGLSIGSTAVAVGLVLAFGALFAATRLIDDRTHRRQDDSTDENRLEKDLPD